MTTGYFSEAGFVFGKHSQPEISRPSKLFQVTNCGSTKFTGFSPPVSLAVQRSSFAVETSTEYTSEGEWEEFRLNARSRLFSCQAILSMVPAGSHQGCKGKGLPPLSPAPQSPLNLPPLRSGRYDLA